MSRLALAGLAWFVVYYEHKDARLTYIVEPRLIGKMDNWTKVTDGFDHAWVLDFVREQHTDSWGD